MKNRVANPVSWVVFFAMLFIVLFSIFASIPHHRNQAIEVPAGTVVDGEQATTMAPTPVLVETGAESNLHFEGLHANPTVQ